MLVLASTSRFRRQLLSSWGLTFESMAPDCDEYQVPALGESLDSKEIAIARASLKARSGWEKKQQDNSDLSSLIVIGCDQTLEFQGQCFDKVTDKTQAKKRLLDLQGESHDLHSAFTLWGQGGKKEYVESIRMVMGALTETEVESYLSTDEWQRTVGCYQYENQGNKLFIDRSLELSTVIGLPKELLLKAIEDYK